MYAFIVFALATVALFILASGARSWASVGLYAPSLAAMFAASALYHLPNWSVRAEAWMRRLDHAAIFVFIAGSYTPVCLLAMYNDGGILLLILVWSVAGLGILQSMLWIDAPPPVCAALYLAQGWLAIPFLSRMAIGMGTLGFTLVVVGGVFFTIGAVVFSVRRPDPVPAVFGYHEVFHSLVIVGCTFQFAAMTRLVALGT